MAILGNRSGFTLVELLVVMGLFGALATISTGGYYAIVRGMEERGAISSATSIVRSAQQRARIDRLPTALYLYNELITEGDEDDARAQGVAVAVRMGGRISRVDGDLLCDEFSDLKDVYGVTDENTAKDSAGMRLYKMPSKDEGSESELNYWIVGSKVVRTTENEMDFISYSGKGSRGVPMYAFVKSSKNKRSVQWSSGDAYAFEFATMRLPSGYFFSSGGKPNLPTRASDPVKPVKVYFFNPDKSTSDLEDASSVEIYTQRPGKSGAPELKSIGKVQKDSKKI